MFCNKFVFSNLYCSCVKLNIVTTSFGFWRFYFGEFYGAPPQYRSHSTEIHLKVLSRDIIRVVWIHASMNVNLWSLLVAFYMYDIELSPCHFAVEGDIYDKKGLHRSYSNHGNHARKQVAWVTAWKYTCSYGKYGTYGLLTTAKVQYTRNVNVRVAFNVISTVFQWHNDRQLSNHCSRMP